MNAFNVCGKVFLCAYGINGNETSYYIKRTEQLFMAIVSLVLQVALLFENTSWLQGK